ncbi:Ribosomal protein L7Ae [Alteribacillus persepolensis]|uniref:Ribosomal protein L7Ae n=1 Tax=Alteribacillus persepolensis TaxID=568899 RepID=A0A1G7YSL6_9BACI|nr:YlxQ family RNA-binding protein [Alteribacillus persepolensis]SDG99199.1 Ribosomal protein L7Ae [Alteribacillus persepolensis]
MTASFLSFLGLAARAGRVKTGDDTVLKEMRKGSLHLVIIASDASPNTQKKFRDKSSYYHVPMLIAKDRDSLGQAIGKHSRVIVGVTDKGFANKLISMLDD